MPKTNLESTRVVIVGTGMVGSTAAFAIMTQGIASEIVLIDMNKKKSQGEAMDMEHGLSFVPEAKIWAGDYKDCKDADVVVICGGMAQKPGQTRMDLAKINVKIITDIVKNIKKYTKKAIILMVTNPLDVLTYTALKVSGYPKNQVFGTGTTLDSSRFRYLLGEKFKIDSHSMGAYLIGEHGDSEVPVYSHANVMGENIKSLPNYNKKDTVLAYKKTKNAAYEIISRKGATYYGIAATIARIVQAILNDEDHIFPVSSFLNGEYGLKNVCLSLPTIIGRSGIKRMISLKLSEDELKKLKKSGQVIRQALDDAGVK
jgi:L-lactate dehydrogenase